MYIQSALIIIILTCSSSLFSEENYGEFKGCGKYKISGVTRKDPDKIVAYVVNENTKSEYKLYPKPGELAKHVGHINIHTEIEVNIVKMNGTKGIISNPQNLKLVLSNPLNPSQNTGFILLKKTECEK